MTVPFNRLPPNQRAPFFYVEFDNSMANRATTVQRTLLIGQMLSTATATPGIPQKVSSYFVGRQYLWQRLNVAQHDDCISDQ